MMCLEQKSELRYILIEVAFRITDNVKVFDLMPQEMEEFQKEIYNKWVDIWVAYPLEILCRYQCQSSWDFIS